MMSEETHLLLHVLWTKAVGAPGYDKREWMDLESILGGEEPTNRRGRGRAQVDG